MLQYLPKPIHAETPMSAARQNVQAFLEKLSNECALEEIRSTSTCFRRSIRYGIEIAEQEDAIAKVDAVTPR